MQHEINSSNFTHRVHDLISALKPLKTHPNRQLNLARFGARYNLSNEILMALLDLVLQFQKLVLDDLEGFRIQPRWKNGNTYLNLVPRTKKNIYLNEIKEINLSSKDAKILLDLTYVYQYVKIGKGFDPKLVQSDLCQKCKYLHKTHPYLVEKNGNGLLYPTSLAVQLGAELRIYNKLNRKIDLLGIKDYVIHIGGDHNNG